MLLTYGILHCLSTHKPSSKEGKSKLLSRFSKSGLLQRQKSSQSPSPVLSDAFKRFYHFIQQFQGNLGRDTEDLRRASELRKVSWVLLS